MKPCDLTATDARNLIARKQISPTELLDSCLERMDEVNAQVNGVVAMNLEAARAETEKAEQAVMRGDDLKPMEGLPLGIKDLVNTAGLKSTLGSLATKDFVPTEDDGLVRRLKEDGAIVQFKTNTPEWGAGGNTFNPVYGVSGNPFAPELTCGGSSGGSAIALATGMLPLCHGSDHAGSLRIPAAYCGVVGMRPSAGVVPWEETGVGYLPLAQQGPMGRNVEDTLLAFRSLARQSFRDSVYSKPTPGFDEVDGPVDLSGLRIAVSADLDGFAPIEEGIRETFEKRVKYIEGSFKDVEVASPDMTNLSRTYEVIRSTEFLGRYSETMKEPPETWPRLVKNNMDHAATLTADDVGVALAEQNRLFLKAADFFEKYDVLITPTVAIEPWKKHEIYPAGIAGHASSNYFDWVRITYAFTLLGAPSISIPAGKSTGGLPFGLQIVAPRLKDVWLCHVALGLEELLEANPETARPIPDIAWLAAQEAEDPLAKPVV